MMADVRAIRIGDAEREGATTALGEHYAAGRLTKDEFDERAERVSSARFEDDLAAVFADLPRDRPAPAARPARTARVGRARAILPQLMWAPLMMLPVLAIGLLVLTVLVGAPWLMIMLFWFCAMGMFGHRGGHGHRGRRTGCGRA